MEITASAISLNVDDVTASATFIKQHFDFKEEMSAEGLYHSLDPMQDLI